MRCSHLCACSIFALLLALDMLPRAVADETGGVIAAVDVIKNEISVSEAHGGRSNFKVSQAARIIINNRPARLAELGVGDRARIIFQRTGKDLLATEIHAMQM